MPTKRYALIAREGHGTLALVTVCALSVQWVLGFNAAIPAWLLLVLVVYLYRDPTRTPPSRPLAIVSPLHGIVRHVGPRTDPWLRREAECIVVASRLTDVRSVYAPTEGKIIEQWSAVPDADAEIPHYSSAFHIRTDENDDVVLVISRGEWGGRLRFAYNPGERIGHGRRIGFATVGGQARLYLPAGTHYNVAAGDRVTAGSSVVASFVHLTAMAKQHRGSTPEATLT